MSIARSFEWFLRAVGIDPDEVTDDDRAAVAEAVRDVLMVGSGYLVRHDGHVERVAPSDVAVRVRPEGQER